GRLLRLLAGDVARGLVDVAPTAREQRRAARQAEARRQEPPSIDVHIPSRVWWITTTVWTQAPRSRRPAWCRGRRTGTSSRRRGSAGPARARPAWARPRRSSRGRRAPP